ncbi:helix-turn-helix transcriptional regulator [Pararhizobium polonicum]|uniref:helix-turn-helix transcriptional regulator n=1 Tax=Pararhizobium polonicum TaxID=1612624 RepID=UPI00083A0CAB|nr:AlpA family phage regulatory protein [Pararhizobium polonicum]
MSDQRLLSREDLGNKGIRFSKTHLWRLMGCGRFPKTVPVGLKRRAWVESEIDEWIRDRVAERDRGAS